MSFSAKKIPKNSTKTLFRSIYLNKFESQNQRNYQFGVYNSLWKSLQLNNLLHFNTKLLKLFEIFMAKIHKSKNMVVILYFQKYVIKRLA